MASDPQLEVLEGRRAAIGEASDKFGEHLVAMIIRDGLPIETARGMVESAPETRRPRMYESIGRALLAKDGRMVDHVRRSLLLSVLLEED